MVSKPALAWGCSIKAHDVPYNNVPVSVMVCIICLESVQKCEHMGCVVWSKDGMMAEDTMRIGDDSTHCDVPTTLMDTMDCMSIQSQYSLKTENLTKISQRGVIQYTGKQCCV